jgi:hypothetical protein
MSTRRSKLTLIAVTALVLAAPAAIADSQPAAAPDDSQPTATGTTAPTSQPTEQPTPDPKPEPSPRPTHGPKHRPTPQPTPVPTPEPAPQPTPVPTPEPSSEPAAGTTPTPTNGGVVCFLTSVGLICPGDPACVITSTGVSCASNCILTSAGLSCPRGKVLQNPRRCRGLKVRPRRVRASRRGVVKLRVTYPRGVKVCRVDLRLRRRGKTLARKVVRVNGGRTRTVSLKLKREARRKLARGRSLRVIAVAAARSAAGQRATTRMRIRILAPRRRR